MKYSPCKGINSSREFFSKFFQAGFGWNVMQEALIMLSVRYGMYGNWVVTGPCTHWCVAICLSTRDGLDFSQFFKNEDFMVRVGT